MEAVGKKQYEENIGYEGVVLSTKMLLVILTHDIRETMNYSEIIRIGISDDIVIVDAKVADKEIQIKYTIKQIIYAMIKLVTKEEIKGSISVEASLYIPYKLEGRDERTIFCRLKGDKPVLSLIRLANSLIESILNGKKENK